MHSPKRFFFYTLCLFAPDGIWMSVPEMKRPQKALQQQVSTLRRFPGCSLSRLSEHCHQKSLSPSQCSTPQPPLASVSHGSQVTPGETCGTKHSPSLPSVLSLSRQFQASREWFIVSRRQGDINWPFFRDNTWTCKWKTSEWEQFHDKCQR